MIRIIACFVCDAIIAFEIFTSPASAAPVYVWFDGRAVNTDETLAARIPPRSGFARVPAAPGSWAEWLRGLPMKPEGAPVLTYTGGPKWRQDVHAAVVDIDVGDRDLQQCADAIMRLRAEWQFASGRAGEIAFNYTGGKRVRFSGGKNYKGFRKYMTGVFAYAGTYSLEREMTPVKIADIAIGDVFIRGGFPGHAVLVADMAENNATGEKRFLLVQSFMPAQNVHVLKNPNAADGSPWYPAAFEDDLVTPEWVFSRESLKRFPG